MKNLLFIILTLLVISCKKNKKIHGIREFNNHLELSFIDTNDLDLLDHTNPSAYNRNTIKLYHLIDGEMKLISFGAITTYTNGISFSCDRELCTIAIVLSDTTFLELSNQITDTIYREINERNGYNYISKIWYNGELIYDPENAGEKYFTIVK